MKTFIKDRGEVKKAISEKVSLSESKNDIEKIKERLQSLEDIVAELVEYWGKDNAGTDKTVR
jgi:phage FluMu protein gp41